ncbi:hypothetical protein [Nostoc sp. CALU 1950]|uniref:hypothetical protein n=1 Tax=Nostoc sp. CALU 1950 TaxID=3104321 RepID=UPI003EB9C138
MKSNEVYEILIKTLEVDQSRISNLDSTQFTIKGWSITLVSLLVGLTFQYKNKAFLYIGIVAIILFVILDYLYRRVQLNHVERSTNILEYIQNTYLENSQNINIQIPFGKYRKNFIKDNSIIFLFHGFVILMLIILIFIPMQ